MWCRRHRSWRQRRPSRGNGSCIPPPRTWQLRIGQKFVISSSPRPKCFPPPHCPIWTGVTQSWWRWSSRLTRPDGICAAFRCRSRRSGRNHCRSRWPARPSPCPCRRRASSRSRKTRTRQRSRCFRSHITPSKPSRRCANAAASQSGSQSTPPRSGGKPNFGAARKPGASKFAGHANSNAAGARRGPLKQVVQVKKRRNA